MLSSSSTRSNQSILIVVLLLLALTSLSNALATIRTRRRSTFQPILKVTTLRSSTQEDNYFDISNMLPRFEQPVEIDILLPVSSSGEVQQEQEFPYPEGNFKSDQKPHVHLDEDEMADLLDHADHASGDIQEMILSSSSNYSPDMMMYYHDNALLSQLDVSTLKPLIEYLTNAGLLL